MGHCLLTEYKKPRAATNLILANRTRERSCRTQIYERQLYQIIPISTHKPATSASQSQDGQYRHRSGQYAALDRNRERAGQYVTQRRRISLLRARKYKAAED